MNEELCSRKLSPTAHTPPQTLGLSTNPFPSSTSCLHELEYHRAAVLIVWYSDSILNTKLCRKKWQNFAAGTITRQLCSEYMGNVGDMGEAQET